MKGKTMYHFDSSYDMDRYREDLERRQAEHLRTIKERHNDRPCLHDGCSECHGTGIRSDGTGCIHMISCSCPKCSPYTLCVGK
jgi:hypothetical protein